MDFVIYFLTMAKITKLNPLILEKVWGGQKLIPFHKTQLQNIGETWEVSTLKEGSSFLGDKALSEFCELSYLVKFIDTSDHLSIQVHPDDEYAKQHEKSKGKTETWIILDAEEGSGIYLGLKPGVTKKEFKNALSSGMQVNQFLQFHEVKKNDFFSVPAGTIHAIGSGVTLCEIQQSSGITYRVWDWNRMGLDGKPRELHIDKAMDSINFKEDFYKKQVLPYQKNMNSFSGINTLYDHPDFKVQFISKIKNGKLSLNLNEQESIIVLEGKILGDIELNKFEAALVLERGHFEFEVSSDIELVLVS